MTAKRTVCDDQAERIRTKRIYETPENSDGSRILVDRIWPRGMSKERARLDGWEKGIAPPWKKVHDVPDFVHFTHEKHLKKFIFDNPGMPVEKAFEVCAFCHGEVKNMTVARKVKPLNMGFCVRCHEANNGPNDCWKCHK